MLVTVTCTHFSGDANLFPSRVFGTAADRHDRGVWPLAICVIDLGRPRGVHILGVSTTLVTYVKFHLDLIVDPNHAVQGLPAKSMAAYPLSSALLGGRHDTYLARS